MRPRNSSVPSARQRARSPVRYSRAPGVARRGSGRSARPSAPAGRGSPAPGPSPPMYSSPGDADRHRLQARVEDVDVACWRWAGRWSTGSGSRRQLLAGGPDGRLGGAVHVPRRRRPARKRAWPARAAAPRRRTSIFRPGRARQPSRTSSCEQSTACACIIVTRCARASAAQLSPSIARVVAARRRVARPPSAGSQSSRPAMSKERRGDGEQASSVRPGRCASSRRKVHQRAVLRSARPWACPSIPTCRSRRPVLRRGAVTGVAGSRADLRPLRVQADHACLRRAGSAPAALVGDEHRQARVREHEGQAIRG